jgi:stress response protein YsnF
MDRHNLVAVYRTRADAERAMDDLLRFGIPAENMRLSPAAAAAGAPAQELPQERHSSFWNWLFGDVPEEDRRWYLGNLRDTATALSILVDSESQREQVTDILESHDPINFGGESAWAATPVTVPGAAAPVTEPGAAAGERRVEAPEPSKEGETVIPVVKEELAIGKRAAERRYRVRSYVVETPVEEQVRLRDERIVVEHRPAGAAATSDPGALREREFEVIERHEEPVVEKRTQPVEEVVVRREADERVETVRETVRETRVDVDKEPAERRVDGAGTAPPERKP